MQIDYSTGKTNWRNDGAIFIQRKGEKYTSSSYGEFSSLNGYCGDPYDGLTATPFCRFDLDHTGKDSDEYFGWNLIDFQKRNKLNFKEMNIKVFQSTIINLKLFRDANYLLIRPDKYLFSRSKNSDLKSFK